MHKIKTIGLALLVLALMIPAMAFAKGLHSMDISGPGIDGTLHLSDQDEMMDLMDSSFFDYSQIVRLSDEDAAALGDGYEFTMHIAESPEDEPFHAELGVYYPDPEGGRGYIHWIGSGDPAVEIMAEDKWTRVTERGETAFWSLMEAYGVSKPVLTAPVVEAAPVSKSVVEEPVQAAVVKAEAENSASASQPVVQAPQNAPINWAWIGAGAALLTLIAVGAWIVRQRQTPQADPAAASD